MAFKDFYHKIVDESAVNLKNKKYFNY